MLTTTMKCPGSGLSITTEMWDDERATVECPQCGKRCRSHGFQATIARHAPDEEGFAQRRKARKDRETLFQRCTEDAADDIQAVIRADGSEWHVQDYSRAVKLAIFYSEADAIEFRDAKRKVRAAELMKQFA